MFVKVAAKLMLCVRQLVVTCSLHRLLQHLTIYERERGGVESQRYEIDLLYSSLLHESGADVTSTNPLYLATCASHMTTT